MKKLKTARKKKMGLWLFDPVEDIQQTVENIKKNSLMKARGRFNSWEKDCDFCGWTFTSCALAFKCYARYANEHSKREKVKRKRRNSRLEPFCILTVRANLCGSPNGLCVALWRLEPPSQQTLPLSSFASHFSRGLAWRVGTTAWTPRFTPSCPTWSSVLFSLNPRVKILNERDLKLARFSLVRFARFRFHERTRRSTVINGHTDQKLHSHPFVLLCFILSLFLQSLWTPDRNLTHPLPKDEI